MKSTEAEEFSGNKGSLAQPDRHTISDEHQIDKRIHLPEHPPKKRRWSHYAFDFLMLFLAVTLGFFVENQREKLSEREDERRLVTTLLDEVKTDITRVDEIVQRRLERIEKNDSLFLLLSSPAKKDQMASTYELLTSARSLGTLFYMSNTMIYLANGGFQRLNSVAVEDETRKYYLCIQDLLAAQESLLNLGQELSEKSRVILDAEVIFAARYPERQNKRPNNLFSTEPGLINQYANVLLHFNGVCGSQIKLLKKTREQGEKLMATIKEEYDL